LEISKDRCLKGTWLHHIRVCIVKE
jgi:hypothetical protein